MRTELGLLVIASTLFVARPADASCIPGFDYAVFAKGNIHIENNCGTDSYNSAIAPYATGGCEGNLGTNSAVMLENSVAVCGTASTTGGGVSTANTATYTTPAKTISPVTLADVTVPSYPNNGSATWSDNATHVVAPNKTYTTLGCTGNNTIISLSAGDYVATTVNLSKCTVNVTSGPVFVYVKSGGTLNFSLGVKVNVPSSSGLPTNLVFLYAGTEDVNFSQLSTVYAGVYAPNATIHVNNQVNIFGALVGGGSEVHIEQHSSVHYDQAMAGLGGAGFACASKEVSRATPIVATIDGQTSVVQGTYETSSSSKTTITTVASVSSFAFPYLKGHLRARIASSISTTGSTFASGNVQFDAAATGKIPAVNNAGCNSFDGSCRNVFTVTQTPNANGTSFHPPRVQLNDANASLIGALIAPTSVVTGINATHWQTIVRAVLAGKLGGVDRSTVAVIPPSSLAGLATRPTIAYFGATDGMIHAVCASVGGTTESDTNVCPSLGTELWAFMPRVQLPLVRQNTTRIDGSVRVVDAFGDFVNNPANGARTFRTILTFQTGFADTTLGADPAVYSLDVTDPANPIVLWESTKPSTQSAYDLGVGLAIASSPVIVGGKSTNLVFAETNNGGTGGTGVVATALSLETGAKVWQFGYAYPSPPRGNTADAPLPTTGVPGGAVAVDLQRTGFASDLVMGDLYGNLWRLDAATGTSKTGTSTPLFSFATNKHPIGALPTIYSDGNQQFAAFASGGYTDPTVASWSAGTQALISISLAVAGPFPINDSSPKLALKENLGANEKAFGQVLVVGSELFVTTDTTDVNLASYGTNNNTGHAFGYNLTTATVSTSVVVRGGAAALGHAGTTLYSSSSDQQQELATGALSTEGATVDTATIARLDRKLWLRTQ